MNEADNLEDNSTETDLKLNAGNESEKLLPEQASSQPSLPNRSIIGRKIMFNSIDDNTPEATKTLSKHELKIEQPTGLNKKLETVIDTDESKDNKTPKSNEARPDLDTTPIDHGSSLDSALDVPDKTTNGLDNIPPIEDNKLPSTKSSNNKKPNSENALNAIYETNKIKSLEEINNRKYFVPIDNSARNRSINFSIGLTILFIILSLALIDLMLDSGTILLLQKIPHTHFFTNVIYSTHTLTIWLRK